MCKHKYIYLWLYTSVYCKYCIRIKEQLVIHWDTTLRRLRTQLIQFISNNIKDTQEKEVLTRYTNQSFPNIPRASYVDLNSA